MLQIQIIFQVKAVFKLSIHQTILKNTNDAESKQKSYFKL